MRLWNVEVIRGHQLWKRCINLGLNLDLQFINQKAYPLKIKRVEFALVTYERKAERFPKLIVKGMDLAVAELAVVHPVDVDGVDSVRRVAPLVIILRPKSKLAED
jgi:hypothetical protein